MSPSSRAEPIRRLPGQTGVNAALRGQILELTLGAGFFAAVMFAFAKICLGC